MSEQLFSSNYHAAEAENSGKGEWIEFEFSRIMSYFVADAPFVAEDEILNVCVGIGKKSGQQKLMVEKTLDALTAEDVRVHWKLVEAAIRKEIASFAVNGVCELQSKASAKNTCTPRWVHRFKIIDGVRTVKSRLTIRGFKTLLLRMMCMLPLLRGGGRD